MPAYFNVKSEMRLQDPWNRAGISAHHWGVKDNIGLCAAAHKDASCADLHGSLGVRDAQTKVVALPVVCSINRIGVRLQDTRTCQERDRLGLSMSAQLCQCQ